MSKGGVLTRDKAVLEREVCAFVVRVSAETGLGTIDTLSALASSVSDVADPIIDAGCCTQVAVRGSYAL